MEKMNTSVEQDKIYAAECYGICGDGRQINTPAINGLIEMIWKNGGGTLVFSKGNYRTGSVRLRSGVKLYLADGVIISGTGKSEDFPETDHEIFYGRERGAASALFWAADETDIAIEGSGTGVIDGGGSFWWHRKDGRRPCVIEFSNCKNVRIQGIKITNSPFWTIHPFVSEKIRISNIWIQNPPDSPNTDGINPESCNDVQILSCTIDVGDDCIALKAGKENEEGREFPPCQNIVISDCVMKNGHGGVVIGSELSGGVRNVTVRRLKMNHTDRGIRIKTKRLRGNRIENISVSDITIEDVICPLVINCFYRGTTKPEDYAVCSSKEPVMADIHTPRIRNITIQRLEAQKVRAAAVYMEGLPEMPIENCSFSDIRIEMDSECGQAEEPAMTYEGKVMRQGGFWARNVKDISLTRVTIENAAFEFDIQ